MKQLYLEYILDQLSGLDEVSCRAMMGEYIIYFRGKIVGGWDKIRHQADFGISIDQQY